MNKQLIIICFTLITLLVANCKKLAEPTCPDKPFGPIEAMESIQQTTDGGYIAAGYAEISNDYQVYLIKTDSSGNWTWTKTFGGGAEDKGYSVKQTTDGGYIVAGHTYSYGSGGQNIYVIKTDSAGDCTWARTYDTGKNDLARTIQQTTDSGYILGGDSGTSGFDWDMLLLKIDVSGNSQWSKTLGTGSYDFGYEAIQTLDGGYAIAGYSGGYGSFTKALAVKTDSLGNIVWQQAYGDTDVQDAYAIQQTSDTGYIITGERNTELYLIKTDVNGNSIWTRTFSAGNHAEGRSIKQTTDGSYIICGVTSPSTVYDLILLKTDSAGNYIWLRTYGTDQADTGECVIQTTDGGYAIAGLKDSGDVYLMKTDSSGNAIW